jgi:hypothetical protein
MWRVFHSSALWLFRQARRCRPLRRRASLDRNSPHYRNRSPSNHRRRSTTRHQPPQGQVSGTQHASPSTHHLRIAQFGRGAAGAERREARKAQGDCLENPPIRAHLYHSIRNREHNKTREESSHYSCAIDFRGAAKLLYLASIILRSLTRSKSSAERRY